MAMPLKALSVTAILLLLLAAFVTPECEAHGQKPHKGRHNKNKGKHNKFKRGLHNLHQLLPQPGQSNHPQPDPSLSVHDAELFKHSFKPEPWKHAHATFYEGDYVTFGGACGYEDVGHLGFGEGTAALSTVLFNDGDVCGACFEIRCINSPQWCKPGKPSLFITATNFCPPNFAIPSDNGGWCNPPREHFDIAYPAFAQIAEYKAGIVPVEYRRVPCRKQGGIKFNIAGSDYYSLISVWNVAGAGQVKLIEVKGDDDKLPWTPLIRLWGQKWQIGCKMSGQQLSFRVTTSDGRCITSEKITPSDWHYGQTFEGNNFL